MNGLAEKRFAVVLGTARPYGAAIVERLRHDAFGVTAVDGGAIGDLTGEAPLDVLVLNAPVRQRGLAFRDISEDDFRAALDQQLYELVAAGQWAASRMRPGASIVHVASRAHLGAWGGAHDIAVGAALVAMSRSMALELDGGGIRVNTLAPDFAGDADGTADAREIAGAVAWLAGPDGAAISGETILLNRGRSLRMPRPHGN